MSLDDDCTAKPAVALSPGASMILQAAHNELVAAGQRASDCNVALYLAEYAAGLHARLDELETARGFNRGKPNGQGAP